MGKSASPQVPHVPAAAANLPFTPFAWKPGDNPGVTESAESEGGVKAQGLRYLLCRGAVLH